MNTRIRYRAIILMVAMIVITAASARMQADTGTCSGATTTLPFTDVPGSSTFFCSIAEAYFSGLTNGTTPTTYSPVSAVPREQMAAFVTRTMDQSLKRGSKRAVLDQNWTTQSGDDLALTAVGTGPQMVTSDGADLWVANAGSGTVSRVRASDGRLLETWTGATDAFGALVAMGKVLVTGSSNPGKLYQIDPTQAAGPVTVLSSALGEFSSGIAYDGQRIWIANPGPFAPTGSVSIITLNPFTVTNISVGFREPYGVIYDGANIWVTDGGDDRLKKLDSSGTILTSIPVGFGPSLPAFDGTNIWVPNRSSDTVTVVRASGGLSGTVMATLAGNGLNHPTQAAFDGERILLTNLDGSSVSLWKAADFTPIGTFSTERIAAPTGGPGTFPTGACSDGLNFWVTLGATNRLARF